MPPTVRAVRGATTVETTPRGGHRTRSSRSSRDILERNDLVEDDIISILFTATEDIVSIFPATAARSMGLGAVPLICARELVGGRLDAALHPGHAARHHRPPRATRSTTSTSRAPKDSVTTSPTEDRPSGEARRAMISAPA